MEHDPIPRTVHDLPTAKMRKTGGVPTLPVEEPAPPEEDAPSPAPGVVTSALKAGSAIADVGAAVKNAVKSNGSGGGRGMSAIVAAVVGLLGGSTGALAVDEYQDGDTR